MDNKELMLDSRIERKRKKSAMKLESDKRIVKRFEQLREVHGASDATVMVSNEFAISIPTVYNIRRRVGNL